jgi:hypothetical protein
MGGQPKDQAKIEHDANIPGDQETRRPVPSISQKSGDGEYDENEAGEKKPPPSLHHSHHHEPGGIFTRFVVPYRQAAAAVNLSSNLSIWRPT